MPSSDIGINMIRHLYDGTRVTESPNGIRRYDDLPSSLIELLSDRRDAFPDRPTVGAPGEVKLTYDQLFASASRVAGGLRALGCARGDRIGLRLPNSVDWVVAYWGIVLAGATVVTIGHKYADREVSHIVEDSGLRLVIDTVSGIPTGEPYMATDIGGHDLAAIFYTSGTTGVPKGVMITHDNAIQSAETCSRAYAAALGGEELRSLVAVPLSHITGCHSQMVTTVHCGGLSVVMPYFSVENFLGTVSSELINACVAVPTIWWGVIHDPQFAVANLSSLKAIMYGGAPTPPDLVLSIGRSFPKPRLQNLFGATECTGLLTALPHRFAVSHSDSVGQPMPVCDVRIDSPDPRGVGELLVRGPNVTPGYWNRPDATAAAFTDDGWYRMGDIARIDEDGFVYVVDRLKDMIIRGGEKVFCVEVEGVLSAAPNVFEIAVVAVPDDDLGERVGAVLSSEPDAAIDLPRIVAYARQHLSRHKIPELWYVSQNPLPRNAGGKLLKARLKRDIDWTQATAVHAATPRQSSDPMTATG